MPYLSYTTREGKPDFFELTTHEVVIGRLSKCDIVLPRPTVSRRHARVYRSGDRWFVADLGSSHGTLVNDQRVTEKALNPGDEIHIGTASIMFVLEPTMSTKSQMPWAKSAAFLDDMEESTDPLGPKRPPGDTADIVAKHALDSGQLVRTIARAQRLDVTRIVKNPLELLADLEADGLPAKAPGTPGEAGDAADEPDSSGGRDVASHLLTLVRISDELRRCTDVQSVCSTAIEMLLTATKASRGVIALRGDDNGFTPIVQCTADGQQQEVKVSQTFVDQVVTNRVALVAVDTGQDQALSMARSVVAMGIRSILCAPLWDSEAILGYIYLDSTGLAHHFGSNDLDFASAVGHQAAAELNRLRLLDQIRQEQERRRNLGRFLAPDVILHIENEARAGRLDPTLSAREQEVTILFADIKGFTTLSEQLAAADIKRLLDDYFDCMTEIIVDRYKGTLDKYIGDAIMALFGAPFSADPRIDARNAVAAAVAMRDTILKLRKEKPEYANVEIRIGINTGRVVAGMIGSQRRLEYSVIGDAVNVASRLESSGEAGAIQIGESTYEYVREAFECRFAGKRKVKNRAQPVTAWWVVGAKKG